MTWYHPPQLKSKRGYDRKQRQSHVIHAQPPPFSREAIRALKHSSNSGRLLDLLVARRRRARLLLDDGRLTVGDGVLARHRASKHVLEGAEQRRAALKDREEADGDEGAEDPQDADGDPPGEEGLAEDVAAAVQREGPEDEEDDGL